MGEEPGRHRVFGRQSTRELDISGNRFFPPTVHEVKWTLSCSVAREVTFPYRFLSFSRDLQLRVEQAAKKSPPNQGFPSMKPILRFKENGSCQRGEGALAFLLDGDLDWLQVVRCFLFKEALLIRRLVLESTLSSLSGVKYRSAIIALSLRFSMFWQRSSF